MARPELGEKRICGNCGAKFYDLQRDPIVCPKCSTVYELHATEKAAPAKAAPAKAAPVEDEDEEEVAVVATKGPEIVSLEEADEDEGETVDGDDIPDDVAVEVEDDDADDTFLETDDDDEDEDVSGIITVGKDDEET